MTNLTELDTVGAAWEEEREGNRALYTVERQITSSMSRMLEELRDQDDISKVQQKDETTAELIMEF